MAYYLIYRYVMTAPIVYSAMMIQSNGTE